MVKAAVVILAGPEGPDNLGRLVNALETVRECDQHDDDVELIFDGAGTQWVPVLEQEDHDYHHLYNSVSEYASVCEYCVGAYGVTEGIEQAGVPARDEHDGHPSIRSLVADGYEVITF